MPQSSFPSVLEFIRSHGLEKFFSEIHRGIEKESLRINQQGMLAQTPHPQALGATLTHPSITTDYSEALLEFITGVHNSVAGCLDELATIHHFAYQQMQDEILWVASMPCFIAEEKDIPIAEYGNSNIGQMKHIYRIGLEQRYGRLMQTIAGLHYNFSLSDLFWQRYQAALQNTHSLQAFKNQHYFHLIRNFQRHAWLLIYLFSASPAICPSFVRKREHQLSTLANGDLGFPHGMCLRMGDLGYQSDAQKGLLATYNKVDDYIQTLLEALFKEQPKYAAIGVKNIHGQRIQLNTNLLQIENEFYSIIRPKTVTHSGEAALIALAERGVEYIEVRCLDLNPFLPLGIDAEQIRFLDAFLLYCLFSPSPELDTAQLVRVREDFQRVANAGLAPNLQLSQGSLNTCATHLLSEIYSVTQLLDATHQTSDYSQALEAQRAKVKDPQLTPAAQILAQLMPQHAPPQHFFHWALNRSKQIRDDFNAVHLDDKTFQRFVDQAHASLKQSAQLENVSEETFELFLHNYYLQYQVLHSE